MITKSQLTEINKAVKAQVGVLKDTTKHCLEKIKQTREGLKQLGNNKPKGEVNVNG